MIKVVLFNGSARAKGNTYHALNVVKEQLEAGGIECEYVWIGQEPLLPCKACFKCEGKRRCSQENDKLNEYVEKILQADGMVIGSPTYFADVSSTVKAFIDRAGMVDRMNSDMYKYKVGAAVVAVRRAGAIHAFSSINNFFLINQIFVVPSSYWNIGIGREPGDVEKDKEGIQTFENLGKNMVYLLKKLKA